jgi:ribosomal protein L29
MAKLDLNTKSEKQLHDLLAEKRNDLITAHRSLAAGELPNPRVVAATKRDIARILTVINDPSRQSKVSESKKEEA